MLSEEELKKVQARFGGGTQPTQPPLPGTLPPEILSQLQGLQPVQPYLSGASGKTPRLTFPQSQEQVARELQIEALKQQVKNLNPMPTEMERERGKMSGAALRFVEDFSRQLGVNEKKGTVANPDLLAYSRDFLPKTAQEALQSSKTRQLYNSLDSAFQEAAIVLTGRQGDVQKLRQLQELYRFGGLVKSDPATIIKRIRNLKQLIQTFDDPRADNAQLSQQMDVMLQQQSSAEDFEILSVK